METVSRVEPPKEFLELIRIILEQNGTILATNKLLLEKLAALPVVMKSENWRDKIWWKKRTP